VYVYVILQLVRDVQLLADILKSQLYSDSTVIFYGKLCSELTLENFSPPAALTAQKKKILKDEDFP